MIGRRVRVAVAGGSVFNGRTGVVRAFADLPGCLGYIVQLDGDAHAPLRFDAVALELVVDAPAGVAGE